MSSDDLNLGEARLLARVRDGESDALETLAERHWGALVRYATAVLGDVDDARDAAQHALIRLWTQRAEWSGVVSPRALLIRLTRNAALDELRRRARRARVAVHDPAASKSVASPEEELAEAELRDALQAAVEALPARRREVFRLAREGGLSYEEIASVMGLSPQTVANHMSLALTDLRRTLAASGAFRDRRETPGPV